MKKQLTIGFDAKRLVKNATGLGNYARTLIKELATQEDCPQLKLFTPEEGKEEWRQEFSHFSQVEFIFPPARPLPFTQGWWRYTGMVDDIIRQNCHLYHGLSGELPRGLQKAGIPSVVTIHDLIFLRHPEYYSPIDVAIYRHKFRLACREATHFIAISERTKEDIIHFGNIDPERIEVIYQSCSPRFSEPIPRAQRQAILKKHHLTEGYVLSVGSIEERKNTLLLVAALTRCPNMRLVLVGKRTPYTQTLENKAREWKVENRLHILHGISSEDLPAIYAGASIFAYPSRYEGFGIPIIEALSAHLPVVAATGSCLEEAGGKEQVYVSPDDVHAMASTIERMLASPEECNHRATAGNKYIQRFLGNQQAIRLFALYERILLSS